MTTFVLVHGAWHGSWCWQHLAQRLASAGHRSLAPDLPGHGPDRTPPEKVTQAGYVDHVVDLLDHDAARRPPGRRDEVVLVGHSMAGVVISEVAERVPHHVDRLVYLAAALVGDGRSMLDVSFADDDSLLRPHLQLSEDGHTVLVPDGVARDTFYADCADDLAAWATAKLVPQPLAPMATPIHVTPGRWGRVPRTYVACEADRVLSPGMQAGMVRQVGADAVVSLPTGHSPFLSHADQLVDALLAG